jgi:F-type H+-transporting ATPase subunit f
MSAIFRRAYTTKTLIPPNVAAATRLSGSAKDGQITQLVDFYKVQKKKRKEKKQSAEY